MECLKKKNKKTCTSRSSRSGTCGNISSFGHVNEIATDVATLQPQPRTWKHRLRKAPGWQQQVIKCTNIHLRKTFQCFVRVSCGGLSHQKLKKPLREFISRKHFSTRHSHDVSLGSVGLETTWNENLLNPLSHLFPWKFFLSILFHINFYAVPLFLFSVISIFSVKTQFPGGIIERVVMIIVI